MSSLRLFKVICCLFFLMLFTSSLLIADSELYSPEDIVMPVSTLQPSPSPTISPNPSQSPIPSLSTSPSPSQPPVNICVDPVTQISFLPNAQCGCQNRDECGDCGGSGRNSCGQCAPESSCNRCSFFDITLWADDTRLSTITKYAAGLRGRLAVEQIGQLRAGSSMPACMKARMDGCRLNFGDDIRGISQDRCFFDAMGQIGRNHWNSMPLHQRMNHARAVWGTDPGLNEILARYPVARDGERFIERFIINDQCQSVPFPDPNFICGRYIVRADTTPLALILSEEQEESSSIVEFNLEPNDTNKKKFYIWKASKNRPLLVYNPDKLNKVYSAAQLFGSWTFGGKNGGSGFKNISHKTELEFPNVDESWSNGYEALSQLDFNKDGFITGKELGPLYLWFDNNQNGVSEEGELKHISELLIKKISTSTYRQDPSSEDLIADLGYQMETPEGLRWGKTIDWMSEGSNSKSELLSRLIKNQSISSKGKNNSPKLPVDSSQSEANKLNKKSLVGLWHWTLEGEEKENFKTEGVFEISVNSEGKLKAYNTIIRPLINRDGNAAYDLQLQELKNLELVEEAAGVKFMFNMLGEDNDIVHNEAFLRDQSKTMEGLSRHVFNSKESESKKIEVNYRWRATKVE